MTQNGIRADQVTQVRGFADQRLRNKDAPLDPSNRRISMIVLYLERRPSEESSPEGDAKEGEPGSEEKKTAAGEKKSTSEQKKPAASSSKQ